MGRAAVDDVVDGVSEGTLNILGRYGVGAAAEVCASANDGLPQGAGESAGDRVVGDADAHGAGGTEYGVGKAGDGFQHEGSGGQARRLRRGRGSGGNSVGRRD